MQLNPKALGLTVGILAGAWWFLAMSFSLLTGIGDMTMTTFCSYHPFCSYTWGGMIVAVIEHLVAGFIVGWLFAWLYNRLSK